MDMHICRMAGCYNNISDLLDEVYLNPHFCYTLVNMLMKNIDDMPDFKTHEKDYLGIVSSMVN